MTLETSKLRHWNSMETSVQKTTYIYCLQFTRMTFKLKEYNTEKSFKLAILKIKGQAFLTYENLKKNMAREVKSKVKAKSDKN